MASEEDSPWASPTLAGKCILFFGLTSRSVGVIFGDLGTSPLYVLGSVFTQQIPSEEELLGCLSLIMWSLILLVTLRLPFLLELDNEGEGGVFALGGLIMHTTKKEGIRRCVRYASLVGCCCMLADSAFTPAVSVLSAVEGVTVVAEGLSQYVLIITIILIILLFMVQPFGTAKIGAIFGPIMIIWFVSIGACGLWRITQLPRVFSAFNPWLGLSFLFSKTTTFTNQTVAVNVTTNSSSQNVTYEGTIVECFLNDSFHINGSSPVFVNTTCAIPSINTNFKKLGAVFLAVTGLEALYADLGHFTAWPIRCAWLLFIFPCLLLQYMGQVAHLIQDPSAISSPFYLAFPQWAFWPMLVLATVATIIASQACITGAFSLLSQAIKLGLVPPMSIHVTSHQIKGQIFIPVANLLLLVLTLAIVGGFGTNGDITNAYGLMVCVVMALTSIFVLVAVREVYHLNFGFVVVLFPMLALDLFYLSATSLKIPSGAWVAVMIALSIFVMLLIWNYGEHYLRQWQREHEVSISLEELKSLLVSNQKIFSPPPHQKSHHHKHKHHKHNHLRPVEKHKNYHAMPGTHSLHSSASSSDPEEDTQMVKLPMMDVEIGQKQLHVVQYQSGIGIFLTQDLKDVPPAVSIVMEQLKMIPRTIVLVKITPTNSARVTQTARAKYTEICPNLYAMEILIGFSEHKVNLLDIVRQNIVPQLSPTHQNDLLTYYSYAEKITVVSAMPLALPLGIYHTLKKLFPPSNHLFKVDSECSVILTSICLL